MTFSTSLRLFIGYLRDSNGCLLICNHLKSCEDVTCMSMLKAGSLGALFVLCIEEGRSISEVGQHARIVNIEADDACHDFPQRDDTLFEAVA